MPLPASRIRFVWPIAILAAAALVSGVPNAATAASQGNNARRDTVEAKQTNDKPGSAGSTTAAKPKSPAKPKPEWPVKGPDILPGSILPHKRIVAYYGNPLSKRMGILGE